MKRCPAISRVVMVLFFLVAGLNHFRTPDVYLSMMPPWLPCPRELNFIAGIAEIMGALGMLIPARAIRGAAGWWLIALLIAVFPANLHVAMNGWPGVNIHIWLLWLRLPFQVLLIVWVYNCCLRNVRTQTCWRL